MFDGVSSDEFHNFLSSRASNSLSFPISNFPLHGNPSFGESFNPFSSSTSSSSLHHHQHQQESMLKNNVAKPMERGGSMDSWSSEEVFALFKVRSSMDCWFPDLSWENVSRKLSELGYKRSACQCKERFEEESRHFNSMSYDKNYRSVFSEFDGFYHLQEKAHVSVAEEMEKRSDGDDELQMNNGGKELVGLEETMLQSEEMGEKTGDRKRKKRRKSDKFEMFKGFCEAIVSKMIAQQEELHNKMIDDLVKRDREMIEREEAWKNQETNRIKLENEIKAQEQASTAERQATIIEFLKRFTSSDEHDQPFATKIEAFLKVNESAVSHSATSLCKVFQDKNMMSPSSPSFLATTHKNPSSNLPVEHNSKPSKKIPESNSSVSALTNDHQPNLPSLPPPFSKNKPCQNDLDSRPGDLGKRWPRDEVLSLINLRCKLSGNIDETKEGAKGPLWERISKGMLELGYKRSAKRCKEKWENINKYFRKTKDNKKRSTDSRTCPYFHQLNSLYNDGTVAPQSGSPEKDYCGP